VGERGETGVRGTASLLFKLILLSSELRMLREEGVEGMIIGSVIVNEGV
jgi:hypothetical protein